MAGMHLLSSAKELSPEALDLWGDRIGSRKLSRQIAALDRFNDRVMGRVFKSDPNITSDASANGSPIGSANGLNNGHAGNVIAQLEQEDVDAAQIIRTDSASFVKTCGVVAYGDVFRKNVTNSKFADLQRHFSQQELRTGCMLRDEHRTFSENQVDMDRLPELTAIAGNHCLAVWMSSIPANFRRELEMVGVQANTFTANSEIGLTQDHCIRIVRSVARQLGNQ